MKLKRKLKYIIVPIVAFFCISSGFRWHVEANSSATVIASNETTIDVTLPQSIDGYYASNTIEGTYAKQEIVNNSANGKVHVKSLYSADNTAYTAYTADAIVSKNGFLKKNADFVTLSKQYENHVSLLVSVQQTTNDVIYASSSAYDLSAHNSADNSFQSTFGEQSVIDENGALSLYFYGRKGVSTTSQNNLKIADLTVTLSYEATTFAINYDLNGGAWQSSDIPSTYTSTSETVLPTPTKTGYTFVGWADGSNVITKIAVGNTGDKSLVAQWEPNQYTVSFNSNGGSTVASQSITYGEKVIQPDIPTKAGYTFVGWYTDAALTTAYNFNSAVTGNMTLYAKWEQATQTVTVSFADGITPAQTITFENGMTWREFINSPYNTQGFAVNEINFGSFWIRNIKYNNMIVRKLTGTDAYGTPTYEAFEPDTVIDASLTYVGS